MSRNIKVGAFITMAVLTTSFTFYFWQIFKTPNLQLEAERSFALLIPEGASYESVIDTLQKNEVINDEISFRFVAKLLNYPERVKAGRYLIKPDATNYTVVQKLREGNQDAVRLTFNNIRLKNELIERIGPRFEFGEKKFREALSDPALAQKYGLDTTTIMSMFLPNTYDIYWNVGTERFLDRMHSEYQKFWSDERKAKAKAINLTPGQVSILASIVEEEQARKPDERPKVAGMYINRLQTGMPLQADPTVKFALGDFAIKRILTAQLLTPSPYNTYLNKGLPPTPINSPGAKALEAALAPAAGDWIYFITIDKQGHSLFTSSYEEFLAAKAKAKRDGVY